MLIDINKIKVSDRIRKDFGDIEELANDIKENGLINPPTVTPEFELIAGERRLRACKFLGYPQIEVRVMAVEDEEHQLKLEISENENRKEFSYSERMDWAKRLERIERIKAKERMGEGVENFPQLADGSRTRDVVGSKSGFGSGKQYEKAKFIHDNADEEVIEQLDKEEISIHKAWLETKAKLEAEVEEEKRKREEAEGKVVHVEKELEELKNKPPEVKEVEVDKTDYEKVERLEREVQEKIESEKEAQKKLLTLEKELLNEKEKTKELAEVRKELEENQKEMEALTQAQIRLKDKRMVFDNVSYLTRDLGGWMRKIRLYIIERGNVSGDEEVHRTVNALIKTFDEAKEEARGWINLEDVSDMTDERSADVIDADYIEVE